MANMGANWIADHRGLSLDTHWMKTGEVELLMLRSQGHCRYETFGWLTLMTQDPWMTLKIQDPWMADRESLDGLS